MPFIRKLDRFLAMTPEVIGLLHDAIEDRVMLVPGDEFVGEARPYHHAYVIHEGWAVRTRDLGNGGRQIMNFLVPGDAAGLAGAFFEKADHTVAALTPMSVSRLDPDRVFRFMTANPRFGAALFWSVALEESMLRERIVGLGRRTAEQRLAHLLVELAERLTAAGRNDEPARGYPMTQQHVADAMGLSLVHVNRTLRSMAQRDLVRLAPGRITVLDAERLRTIAGFDDGQLHQGANIEKAVDRITAGG